MYRPRKRKRGTRWGRMSIVLRESSVWVRRDIPCREEKWRRSAFVAAIAGSGQTGQKSLRLPDQAIVRYHSVRI